MLDAMLFRRLDASSLEQEEDEETEEAGESTERAVLAEAPFCLLYCSTAARFRPELPFFLPTVREAIQNGEV